jgi:hypothetical protein
MLEKKNILLEDYQHWYVEGTDYLLTRFKKTGENEYIRYIKMQKTIRR